MAPLLRRIQALRRPPAPAQQPAAPAPEAPNAAFRTEPIDLLLSRVGLPGALVRQILADLEDLRPWWPIILPIALYVAATTYRRERAEVLAARGPKR
jgi:hypothetical protein